MDATKKMIEELVEKLNGRLGALAQSGAAAVLAAHPADGRALVEARGLLSFADEIIKSAQLGLAQRASGKKTARSMAVESDIKAAAGKAAKAAALLA